MKLAVIVNPRARGVRSDKHLAAALARITQRVHVTTSEELPELAADFARDGVDVVALCGGDGTGQATLTALDHAYDGKLPRIALLGGGTINTIARNFGLVGTPEARLRHLCDRITSGAPLSTVQQSLLRVDGRVGFLFAALLGARFLQRYYDHPTPTPARAARLAIEVALSALIARDVSLFTPVPLDLQIDDEQVRLANARLLVASTVPDVGVGMRICPRARDLPRHFQLIAAALTPTQMARRIPAVQAGSALKGVVDRVCASATIEFAREEPYTLDGDLFTARRLTLETAGPIELIR